MTADFRRGMKLPDIRADELNRAATAARRPRGSGGGGAVPGRIPRPQNCTVIGINSTGRTLHDRSIVAVDRYMIEIMDSPILGRSLARAAGDSAVRNYMLRFVFPDYPQPEPDPDTGETEWPYPEQRLAVIRTTEPVEPNMPAHALIYGNAIVPVKFNADGEDNVLTGYATFIDGNTESLQSATTGPALIISAESIDLDGAHDCSVFFPVGEGGAAAPEEEEEEEPDPGGDGTVTVTKRIDIGKVTDYDPETNMVMVQRYKFDLGTQKYVPDGAPVEAVTISSLFNG